MLQDLCPRCGTELIDEASACAACGHDPTAPQAARERGGQAISLRPTQVLLLALATVSLVVVAFGTGLRLRSEIPAPAASDASSVADVSGPVSAAQLGRVLFAERLGESLELESYRTQFRPGDTIAWRAEFPDPPGGHELTLVIAWYSIRETMRLSVETLPVRDAELKMVASDEVPVRDLVPTAGLYAVSYFAGDRKLAEGIFEVLPPGP